MSPRRSALIPLTVVLLSACGESSRLPTSPGVGPALAAKTVSTAVAVTSTIYDDASGAPLLTRSDDFNGSGFATYTASGTRTKSSIGSQVSSNGWQLLLANQTARTIYLVLASQGIAGVPDGSYSSSVEVYAACFDQANARVSLLGMAAGATNGNCSFGVDFSSGGTKYKLAMGPLNDDGAPTGRATVTCTAVANGACANWTISPNPDTAVEFTLTNGQVASAPAANLYAYGNRGSLLFMGSYHNSYSVALAR